MTSTQQLSTANLAPRIHDLIAANKILVSEGIVDAFGHVSVRSPTNPQHYYIARAMAPELVSGAADIMEITLDGEVCSEGGYKPYLEKDIHGAIYAARPDVQSVIHNHCHAVLPFTVTSEPLRPIVHTCATIGLHIPVWDAHTTFGDTSLLVSNINMARDLAHTLAHKTTVLMRGHGCTVVGRSVREAVYTAVYLRLNAQLQLEASRLAGPVVYLSDNEVRIICQRLADAKPNEGYDRAWEYWCRKAGVEYRVRSV